MNCQSSHFPLVPPNYSKTQLSTNDVLNDLLSFYSTFVTETSTATNGREQHGLVDLEIQTDIKVFFAEENLPKQIKEVLTWWKSNKKNTNILLGLQGSIF